MIILLTGGSKNGKSYIFMYDFPFCSLFLIILFVILFFNKMTLNKVADFSVGEGSGGGSS